MKLNNWVGKLKRLWRSKRLFGNSVCVAAGVFLFGCADLDTAKSTTIPTSPASSSFMDTVERSIITVLQWGSAPLEHIVAAQARKHVITHITLDHQGDTFASGCDPQQYLRNLQTWSRNRRKWLDIPYHYVIDRAGRIYAGRDIQYAGDTNPQYDPSGHALIEVVCNFEQDEPYQPQRSAVMKLMTMIAMEHHV